MTNLYVTYEDGLGGRWYQPRLPSGARLYRGEFYPDVKHWGPAEWSYSPPMLYRSRRKAARIARKKHRERERKRVKEVKEVDT